MRKVFLYILLIICGAAKAQNIALYFELIPEDLVLYMNAESRKSKIDTLSTDYLSMHTSGISTLDIKMLPLTNDSTNILTVIESVETEGTIDSSIKFYTTTWSKLPTEKYFPVPEYKDFYKENDSISLDEFSKLCIPFIVSYRFAGEGIIATIDPEKYLPVETYQKLSPAFARKHMIYLWNDDKWYKQ